MSSSRSVSRAASVGCLVVALALFPALAGGVEIERAVVQIQASPVKRSFATPWAVQRLAPSGGSGVIVSGERILTAAHVVADAETLQVRRHGDGRKYRARALHVIHDADLAILTVDDAAFFAGVTPVPFGTLPEVNAAVQVYGFPIGGTSLNVSAGTVGRLEFLSYAHSGLPYLTAQIDAAINPGNSGGPVVHDGRVIGLAVSTNKTQQRQSNIVPVPVIERMLVDIEDGRYDGTPFHGVVGQLVDDAATRAYFRLPDDASGLLVNRVLRGSSADGRLRADDVILAVDGHDIGEDGQFALRGSERISWQVLITQRQIGESAALSVWRAGERIDVDLPLHSDFHAHRLVPIRNHDTTPRYLLFGGLVFAPATVNLMEALYESDWWQKEPRIWQILIDGNEPTETVRERVVLQGVLPDDTNVGYQHIQTELVESVDGVVVRDLDHLRTLLLETDSAHLAVRLDDGARIFIDAAATKAATQRVMERFRIPAQ